MRLVCITSSLKSLTIPEGGGGGGGALTPNVVPQENEK